MTVQQIEAQMCLLNRSKLVLMKQFSLLWRHNGHDGVSNHQPRDCLLNRLFGRRSKWASKLCVTGLCLGNSPGTGEFPAQMASNAENVSIWRRHHVMEIHRSWLGGGWLVVVAESIPIMWPQTSHVIGWNQIFNHHQYAYLIRNSADHIFIQNIAVIERTCLNSWCKGLNDYIQTISFSGQPKPEVSIPHIISLWSEYIVEKSKRVVWFINGQFMVSITSILWFG